MSNEPVSSEEQEFILRERINDLEHCLVAILRAFDAPHRFKMLDAVAKARKLMENAR
jgi:hypothetical protein